MKKLSVILMTSALLLSACSHQSESHNDKMKVKLHIQIKHKVTITTKRSIEKLLRMVGRMQMEF